MGLFEYFRVWGLFLGFHDIFFVLFRLEREWSAYFTVWQFVGKRRENSPFGVCMVSRGDIMVQG